MLDRTTRTLTAAEAAAHLGVTVKALRVLERRGLIRPGRTAAGWRVYDSSDFERLHQILALRRLGLSLTEVGRVLDGQPDDLDRTLSLQEDALAERLRVTHRALEHLRSARERMARGDRLGVEDLVNLIRETTMIDQPSDAMKAIFAKHYTSEQMETLKARKFDASDQERISRAWADIYAEAEALVGTDPDAAPARALAERAQTLIAEFTRGDPAIAASLQAAWSEASRTPEAIASMPGSPQARAFLSEAQKRLAKG
jgi:DNA-binding transcriptional MerR regulator